VVCKRVFLILTPVKKLCIYPKVAFEICALKCVKILGKVVNKGIYVIL
jgi:hypothetical protein